MALQVAVYSEATKDETRDKYKGLGEGILSMAEVVVYGIAGIDFTSYAVWLRGCGVVFLCFCKYKSEQEWHHLYTN